MIQVLLKIVGTIVLMVSFSIVAEAQSAKSQNKLMIEDINPEPNKASGEDVDQIITNKKMRAESGSKSKLSMSNTIIYYGGSVDAPLSESRPNITGAAGNTVVAFLTDRLGAKYAFNQRKSLSAGIGVRWITPLNSSGTPAIAERAGSIPQPYPGKKVDADNPYVNYQYIYKWLGIQSVFVTGPTIMTATDQLNLGYQYEYDISQNNVYELGRSGLSLGLSIMAVGWTFDKNDSLSMAKQTDYSAGAYPFLEYQFSERFNLRTITGIAVYQHKRVADAHTYFKNKVYQSVGVGISVTRDIFLYPNIQFLPDNMRADTTNVALSANVNIF
jgi:hypothetical protein